MRRAGERGSGEERRGKERRGEERRGEERDAALISASDLVMPPSHAAC